MSPEVFTADIQNGSHFSVYTYYGTSY